MASTAPKTCRFLTSKQVQRLYQSIIKNVPPTQPALLESAVASPINVKYYERQENLFQLAATLSEKIMKNHAFQDGNKRTALLAANAFLWMNGFNLQKIPHDAANQGLANAHVAVTTDTMSAEELGKYYESIAVPNDEDIVPCRDEAAEY